MHSAWRDLLERQLANGGMGAEGSAVEARVPISQHVLDEVIRETVLPQRQEIKRLAVDIKPANQLNVTVTIQKFVFTPTVSALLTVENDVRFPASPTLRLRWRSPGVLGRAAELLGMLVGLPSGIRLAGDVIELDLPSLLRRYGLGELSRFIKRVAIETEAGVLWLTVHLGVD